MGRFLNPSILRAMRRDILDMLAGPDASLVKITWNVATAAEDAVYGVQEASTSETFARALIKPLRNQDVKDVAGVGAVMPGEALFVFDKDVALQGKDNVRFEVNGVEWRPTADPPPYAAHYAAMFLQTEQMAQLIFARTAKGERDAT